MAEPRRTFGPVLLLGLAAGILAAVASNRAWVVPSAADPANDPLGVVADAGEMPLAAALSLVLLACWGVLLVTRRAVRRVVALLGLLAAAGLVATVVVGWVTLPDTVATTLTAQSGIDDAPAVETTGWFWAAATGSLCSLTTIALAVRWVRHWPEMGTRYDAPGTAEPTATPEDASSLELWKAMDEGRDPTA